jgi:cytochrome P450
MRSDTNREGGNAGGTGARSAGGDEGGDQLQKPPYAPEIGHPLLHFLRPIRDFMGFMQDIFESRDITRFHLVGQGDVYALGHPDYLERVLLADREKFQKSEDFRIAFGEGVLTVEGEEWRQQRDALQPYFTRDSVLTYADGMVEQIRRRTDRWEDGQQFDLQERFTGMTLDVLFATVLGRELAIEGDERLREAAENLHAWFVPTSYMLPNWVPTPSRRRFARAKATIREEADRLLAEQAGDAPTDPTEAEDLLSLLVGIREAGLSDSAMLSDERLRDQMVTIIFAGHDTTTGTLTFAFWALANHSEVRERFHAEVDALDGPPTPDDLDDLPVTERVIKETLRLYPPVYILPRMSATDLEMGGYHIPEGERVNTSLWRIQRDERFFENPHEFAPSRWDGDLESDLHNFAYAPFGGGPRICLGREFALVEAKLALAAIGRQFQLEWLGDNERRRTGVEPPLAPQMTLRMEPGQEFRVHER